MASRKDACDEPHGFREDRRIRLLKGVVFEVVSCICDTRVAAVARFLSFLQGAPVLDVVFIAAAIALVAFVGLIAKGVEKL